MKRFFETGRRTGLFASVGIAALAVSAPAVAQDADAADDAAVEETADAQPGGTITVTGSRIPRPEFEGTIPGSQITAQDIETRSFTSVLDALNDLPIVGPGASPFGTNGGQPASLGASFVDLLDLGTARTLTLVNGRRYVSGNAATLFVAANATGSQVDLNSIPISLVERTDVLTVGGAVAYGSDAVSGVVNLILRDDFEGFQLNALAGITEEGDGGNYRVTGTAGTNFADDRGNIAVSVEYVRDDALYGDSREGFRSLFQAPTSFLNGSVRNANFMARLGLNPAAGEGAFLPAASDLVPNNIAGSGFRGGSILVTNPGAIFQVNANITGLLPANFQGLAATDPEGPFSPNFRGQALINQAGNVNLVPGTPIAGGNGCSTANLTTFCNFAPSALPGTAGSAARNAFTNAVIARFAPTIGVTGTVAQRDALALQLLQANIQTPREFLAANPNIDINAFIGTFIPNFLDIANPDAATAGILPRIAVPLQFDAAGNIFNPVVARITNPGETPSTTGGAVGGDSFLDQSRFTALRIQQDRVIANLIGHFDITDNLRIYTENQFANVVNLSPRNNASANTIASATTENVALVFNLNNPYLDAGDIAALQAAGVTNSFVVSRTNQDIVGDNPARVESNTYRTVVGLQGDFEVADKPWAFDLSFTYGQADAEGESFQINDIEYALAVDAVRDPNDPSRIICAAQANPGAFLGQTPSGVVGLETVRVRQPDGSFLEQSVRRVVTQEQISACRPLNLFGLNQFDEEARDYVLARTGFSNQSKQYFALATLGGELASLPGGPLGVAVTGEYRREEINYNPSTNSRFGATRTAALAETEGQIEAYEFSAEARIPIFGEDFSFPLLRNLDISPGVRFVRQSGSAPNVTLVDGSVLNQSSEGDWNTIYTIAGTYRPFEFITFRGNITRSLRQPSVTELFLGGQPAFVGITDPCSNAQIGQGLNPTNRRENCRAAVIDAGLGTDAATADAFLAGYVPSGTAINGNFAGSPGLAPERGKSWTVGAVFEPRDFIPGLQIAADYIDVQIQDQIVPTTITQALQLCFDSPNFPNTSPEIGVNTCSFFTRREAGADRQFEVDNNFNSGFINLGTLQVKALNATASYRTDLDRVFGANSGSLRLFANVYRVFDFLSAPDGNLANAQQSAGSIGRPEWEVQARLRYENEGFFSQWTTNWQSATRLFSGGAPVPGTDSQNEVQDLLRTPAYAIHDATVGYRFGEEEQFNMQFTVRNVTDKQFAGPIAQVFGLGQGRIDDFGRRFVITAGFKY
jgi:outer membrane receptor protein involved in Fe transport